MSLLVPPMHLSSTTNRERGPSCSLHGGIWSKQHLEELAPHGARVIEADGRQALVSTPTHQFNCIMKLVGELVHSDDDTRSTILGTWNRRHHNASQRSNEGVQHTRSPDPPPPLPSSLYTSKERAARSFSTLLQPLGRPLTDVWSLFIVVVGEQVLVHGVFGLAKVPDTR